MPDSRITIGWEPEPDTHERLQDLHAYWLSIRAGGGIPRRKDFDPTAVPALLRNIVLLDVTDDPRNFRFRLVGGAFAESVGRDVKGLSVADVFPAGFSGEVFRAWNMSVEQRRPVWAHGQMWTEGRAFLKWQGVVLPLQSDDGKIGQLLGGGIFDVTSTMS